MTRLAMALMALAFAAQTPIPPPARPVLVVFATELGNITMEVDIVRAPITGANFLKYVDGRFHDGGVVNRAVRPDNTIRHDVPMENMTATGLKHVNGSLSMARNGPDTATASFSIVIGDQPEMDFGGKRNADGHGFAVFGRTVEGMDLGSVPTP